MEIKEILYFLLILFSVISSLVIVIKGLKDRKREFFITNFVDYMSTLEFFQDKAYDIIYKDKLLIYSLEATKIDDKEFHVISKDYSRLVLKLMGEPLLNEYVNIMGDDALSLNLIEYFNRRYEEDEIRKSSVENMMEKPIEELK